MNRLFRPIVIASFCALLACSVTQAQSSHEMAAKPGILKSVTARFDWQDVASRTFPLQYELGSQFDSSKPTVLVIADGQQFYVRPGAVAFLQNELFGDGFNVVGIIGRGKNSGVLSKIRTNGAVDWPLAYRLLRSEQWVHDIEAVRKAVVGSNGQISAPLLELFEQGKILAPTMDLSLLNSAPCSVYLLAGYYDHTADYRSQIALASHFRVHHLLLLNDDHGFSAYLRRGSIPSSFRRRCCTDPTVQRYKKSRPNYRICNIRNSQPPEAIAVKSWDSKP